MKRGQWPEGANDAEDNKPICTCVCGAMSTSPINHNHGNSGDGGGRKP